MLLVYQARNLIMKNYSLQLGRYVTLYIKQYKKFQYPADYFQLGDYCSRNTAMQGCILLTHFNNFIWTEGQKTELFCAYKCYDPNNLLGNFFFVNDIQLTLLQKLLL